MSDSPWPTIHAERAILADELSAVATEDFQTPSLCSNWTVQQVLGHMTATAKMTPPAFALKMARAGFKFDRMSAAEVAREASGTPQQTLEAFQAHIGDSTAPPGPVDSWLGETIVHGTDIRWPLGLEREFAVADVVRAANFYRASNLLIGAKRRIAGVRLRATDTEWSVGEGPEVTGPMLPLLMAMTGRSAALDRLSGPGVAVLRGRS